MYSTTQRSSIGRFGGPADDDAQHRGIVPANFAESYFSLLKRGIIGISHHVSKKHRQRYLEDFDFRWSRRKGSGWPRRSGKRTGCG